MSDINETVADIHSKIKSLVVNRRLDAGTLIEITTHAMSVVEQYPNLSGPSKKAVVLGVVSRIVDEVPVDDSTKNILNTTIQLVLPTVIDKLVDFANYGGGLIVDWVEDVQTNGCCNKKKSKSVSAGRRRRL